MRKSEYIKHLGRKNVAYNGKNVNKRGKKMTEQDIQNIIDILDGKVEDGASRIKINMSQEENAEQVKEVYHHGRCDVGSPWAKGTVKNFDC